MGAIALDTAALVRITEQAPHSIESWVASSLLIFGIAFNGVLAVEKIKLRNRMENFMSRHGFDNRAMGLATRTYCSRQATKVACENLGYAEEYSALCQKKADESDFTWLPHI